MKKYENHHRILHIRINLGSRFQIQQFWFMEQIFKKRILLENRKNGHHHWILHIGISLSTNFQLKQTILIFWTKFVQKGNFQSKTDKMHTTIEFCIFELVFRWNFISNNFEFFDQICPRRIYIAKIWKSEHHHWILHIRISFGTKFQLKLTILVFWTKFAQRDFSGLKIEKVNTTIEFCRFKLV